MLDLDPMGMGSAAEGYGEGEAYFGDQEGDDDND